MEDVILDRMQGNLNDMADKMGIEPFTKKQAMLVAVITSRALKNGKIIAFVVGIFFTLFCEMAIYIIRTLY